MVIFYFILGMFMETLSMMVATVPIIAPIMIKAGYDPVWFGIMIIILMELAMITPPVGINLYVVQGLRKRGRIDDVIIGASPFVITMLLMLLILRDLAADRAVAAADGGELARYRLVRYSVITMLPAASRSARAPGGTTQVASYSSTISGPRGRRRDRRGSAPAFPASRAIAEIGRPRGLRGGLRPARPHLLRHATAFAQARTHELDRDQLDRLVGRRRDGRRSARAPGRRPPRDAATMPRIDRPVRHRHRRSSKVCPW